MRTEIRNTVDTADMYVYVLPPAWILMMPSRSLASTLYIGFEIISRVGQTGNGKTHQVTH